MIETNLRDAALLSITAKLKSIREEKLSEMMYQSPLEQAQFNLLAAALNIEEVILENPSFEIEDVDMQSVSLLIMHGGDDIVGEVTEVFNG